MFHVKHHIIFDIASVLITRAEDSKSPEDRPSECYTDQLLILSADIIAKEYMESNL